MNNSPVYQTPVDNLLQPIEFSHRQREWLDYPTLYGLTAADLPELVRLSLDENPPNCENYEWMLHGLIAVLQLDPTMAIGLYLQQLHKFPDDELLLEEASRICQKVGRIAIEPCAIFLKNIAEDEWTRIAVADGLEEIAKSYPDCRDACVQAMIAQLSLYKVETSESLNSTLVDNLAELKAFEAADLIAEVFVNCDLDEWRTGSWPSVQVRLGLKSKSDFSAKELKATPPPQILAIRESLDRLNEFNAQSRNQQLPLNFSNQAAHPPQYKGFGSSLPRQKKNKQKKR